MEFDWKQGHELKSRISSPCATIGNNRIYLNHAGTVELGESVEYVRVGLNEEKGVLALQPVEEKDVDTITVHEAGRDESSYTARNINSKKLVESILGENTDEKRKYAAEWSDEVDALLVNLNEEL